MGLMENVDVKLEEDSSCLSYHDIREEGKNVKICVVVILQRSLCRCVN